MQGFRIVQWGAIVLMLLASMATQASAGSRDPFFEGPQAVTTDRMFFSIYSIRAFERGSPNMQKIAESGFTAAGPDFGSEHNPFLDRAAFFARVDDVHEHGLGYVAHVPVHPDVVNDTAGFIRGESMAAIPEAELRAHVRSFLDFTLDNEAANATVDAWYILPEELRPWREREMNYLDIVASEIKAYDPQKRPVAMYNPNHRTSEQLSTVANEKLDWTMMGVYATAVPFDARGARIADGVDRILNAAGATQNNPVAVFQLSQDYDQADVQDLAQALGGVSTGEAIRHVIRHDVYQGLVRGIQGVQVWSGCDCREGLTTYAEQLGGYTSVSQDMNGDMQLANVFLHGARRDDLAARLLSGPPTVTHDTVTVDTLAMADIAYGQARFLFLVNSSNRDLGVEVDGFPTDTGMEIEDLFSNAPDLLLDAGTGSLTFGMQPLEVIALRFSAVPEPGSLAMMILGILVLALRSNARRSLDR